MGKAAAPFPVIETPRLVLRRFTPADALDLHACLSDEQAMRFWNMPATTSVDETRKALAWLSKTSSPHNYLAWAVTERDGGACVGMVVYHHREARHRRLQLGYMIAPASQRRGYGAEAVSAVMHHCRSRLKVRRIEALIAPDNTASINLAAHLGFVREGGPLRDYWQVGEISIDALVYASVFP